MTYGYVYKIVINHPGNSLDGCYYIGQHKLNKKPYYGSGIILENYKEKHGIINLNIEILCECISAEDLNKKEAELIGDLYLTDSYRKGGKCLNLKAGGNQPGMTEEVRNKIAEISKKRWEDPEYKKRVAISNSLAQKGKPRYKCRGRTLSLLTKMKIAQKALGRKRNNYNPDDFDFISLMATSQNVYKTDGYCDTLRFTTPKILQAEANEEVLRLVKER